eukprot:CAMPEP_0172597896 /NCGR_PEP_ID=MMETSP1068-20121228/17880_1 /TAXON_ID=35684 /ORGANISM="Pseudopedinella elastica, Strain CCMP716" /LENGTH=223 /DNA_ID=CAMNT_0013397549 /DNA_START=626 /DNA_END=1297 /DNA_ORIENTATION=-
MLLFIFADFCVTSKQSAALPERRANTVASLRRHYAPLLREARAAPVLFATPAYRASVKGSGAHGSHADFTARTEKGYEEYAQTLRRCMQEAAHSSATQRPPDGEGIDGDGSLNGSVKPFAPMHKARVRVASANAAFARVHDERPDLWRELFMDDDYHPSPSGSYLSALVIYKTIFEKLPPLETSVPDQGAQVLFARARRPLAGGQRNFRLPTREEMLYLRSTV